MTKKSYKKYRETLNKVWFFIWEDNSIWSWLVNVVLAFLLIKFVVYPGLGFALGTNYPIVAVVSGSMEHNGVGLDDWFSANHNYYINYNISKSEFETYTFKNGFNTGDIMILKGKDPEKIKRGDTIVFQSYRPDPIIHRVIKVWHTTENGEKIIHYQTKGDNNKISIRDPTLNEHDIKKDQVIGVAVFRIPLLGWIKIWFVNLLKFIVGVFV